MRTLIVGAGATGGYLADLLTAGGRDVTLLVRASARDRLAAAGLRIREVGGAIRTTPVRAVTADGIDANFDLVLMAVRGDAVATAIADLATAVGPQTRILSVANGMAHLQALRDEFGDHRVLGAAAEMATSLVDGIIDVSLPGVRLTIGSLDGRSDSPAPVAAELAVAGVEVTVVDDITSTMWAKFVFIASTAVLTCLTRGTIGDVASVDVGPTLADAVLDEVLSVVDCETDRLPSTVRLRERLKDPAWRFGPSMFRDLTGGRRVEVGVLTELAAGARRHARLTPLLDAATVAIQLHNRRLADQRPESTTRRRK
jgi:2-dehydropantoate 2-reductase